MFYCKYCRSERDDSLINTVYKNSIKCDICARNGTKLTDSKLHCVCGVSFINNVTTEIAHLKSRNHIKILNSLNLIVDK